MRIDYFHGNNGLRTNLIWLKSVNLKIVNDSKFTDLTSIENLSKNEYTESSNHLGQTAYPRKEIITNITYGKVHKWKKITIKIQLSMKVLKIIILISWIYH